MKILVVGSGAREHAMVWKLAAGKNVDEILCAPGNAGIAAIARCVPIRADAVDALADFAAENAVDLTVVGPEVPLCAGIADIFRSRGLAVFGPSKDAARLEGSKDFAKQFMFRYGIPAAKSATFTDFPSAEQYVRDEFRRPIPGIVIKADGLAAGKGVGVCASLPEALDFLAGCFDGAFGSAGSKVVVEEMLLGEEASIFAFTDGETIRLLASAQDHKRVGDGDTGPNTGGMGAYSPAPVIDEAMTGRIRKEILDPFLKGIRAEALDYRGVIFVGIMVTADGPRVLEFNVRFGDPETQAVLSRFDGDLAEVMLAVAGKKLSEAEFGWIDDPAVCVVMASAGYPGSCEKGFEITGIAEAEKTGVKVFHAGTALKDGRIVNAGGRVLGVTATGSDIRQAIEKAYRGVDLIRWQGAFCRRDIGHRALERLKK